MSKEKLVTFWHKIDGPIGALLVALSFGLFGYVIRGYEDGGLVATLLERIRLARVDERNQNQAQMLAAQNSYQERAKLRDDQVHTLIEQNRALFELISRDITSKNKKLADLQLKVDKATQAADAAEAKATQINEKTDQLNKKLDNATQPTAVVPSQPWPGKRKP